MLLGIDTGGTYTDAVLFDEERGVLGWAKSLTTKHDLSIGVSAAVDAVLPTPVPPVRLASLSTTLATNAIVEGHGAPVGTILVGQRSDALSRAGLGRALGNDPVAFVAGGHGADGEERTALDREAARRAIEEHAPRVAAFAVASYFAVRNAAHELAVRDMVRELTGLPVTCSHELTSHLDAPRRALTTVLNARLIGLLHDLIVVVEQMLASRGIDAPLMVVMGDGSLTAAGAALLRPVETILSGPAASVMGARYLSGADHAYIVDIGGTTTDIALLRDGWPALDADGARVGGWRTMVEAVNVHTSGIGGDSEVRAEPGAGVVLGPQRVMPLSLLAMQHPHLLDSLRAQAERKRPGPRDGRFAMRLRAGEAHELALTTGESRLWSALAEGPTSVEALLAAHPFERQLERLARRGLVIESAFTPTDAAHVLDIHRPWCVEAATLGATLWARRRELGPDWESAGDPVRFSRALIAQLQRQSAEALIEAALRDEHGASLGRDAGVGTLLVANALGAKRHEHALLDVRIGLRRPLVAVGASAHAYYPRVAELLHCPLEIPEHAGVCNAVGAVVSAVMQVVKVLVTSPEQGRYRVHARTGVRDYGERAEAIAYAESEASRLAEEQARRAGTPEPAVTIRCIEQRVEAEGAEIFLQAEVIATATGAPGGAAAR